MGEKGLQIALWIGGFMLAIIGTLIVFAWGSIVYIFSRHRDDNDSDHGEFREIAEQFRKVVTKHDKEIVELKTEHNIFKGKCRNE